MGCGTVTKEDNGPDEKKVLRLTPKQNALRKALARYTAKEKKIVRELCKTALEQPENFLLPFYHHLYGASYQEGYNAARLHLSALFDDIKPFYQKESDAYIIPAKEFRNLMKKYRPYAKSLIP